jgi:SNF family Na+-dependent transporter
MDRNPHILNAASNLLGICFIIIGGLKISALNKSTFADEIAWVSAILLLLSAMFSYLAIRCGMKAPWRERTADICFIL